MEKKSVFSFLFREKPSSSQLCVSFLGVVFTTQTEHFTSDISSHQKCGDFSLQQAILSDTN